MPTLGLIAILTGLATQVVKVVLASVRAGRPDFTLLLSTGGMPSSHTATATALALLVADREGVGSPIFSVTLLVCLYAVFEATGLRQEVGKQGRLLNELVDELLATRTLDRARLRELTGHTWAEVAGGAVCGVAGWLVARAAGV